MEQEGHGESLDQVEVSLWFRGLLITNFIQNCFQNQILSKNAIVVEDNLDGK